MGNKLTRKRDPTANGGEHVATEQKPVAEQPAAAPPTECVQEAVKTESPDVVKEESVPPVECAPAQECVPEPEAPPPVKEEPPAEPISVEPVCEPTPPPEPEPEPVAEPLISVDPVPEPAPEPAPEEEPPKIPEPEVLPEPIPEPAPIPVKEEEEEEEQHTDLLAQESIPEPALSSPPLIDLGIPEVAPVEAPPSPTPSPDLVEVPESEDCTMENCTFEQQPVETSAEFLVEEVEKAAAEEVENLEQLVNDVNEENISGLLHNLELKGNDLMANDVKISEDPFSLSHELM